MSIRVMSRVWETSKAKHSNLLLLLAIADFADDNGRAYPSNTTLQIKARLSERQVRESLRDLTESGEITVRAKAGPYGCNEYILPHANPDFRVSEQSQSKQVTNTNTGAEYAGGRICRGQNMPGNRQNMPNTGAEYAEKAAQNAPNPSLNHHRTVSTPLIPHERETVNASDSVEVPVPEKTNTSPTVKAKESEPTPPSAARPPRPKTDAELAESPAGMALYRAFRQARFTGKDAERVYSSEIKNFKMHLAGWVRDGVTPEEVSLATTRLLAKWRQPGKEQYAVNIRTVAEHLPELLEEIAHPELKTTPPSFPANGVRLRPGEQDIYAFRPQELADVVHHFLMEKSRETNKFRYYQEDYPGRQLRLEQFKKQQDNLTDRAVEFFMERDGHLPEGVVVSVPQGSSVH